MDGGAPWCVALVFLVLLFVSCKANDDEPTPITAERNQQANEKYSMWELCHQKAPQMYYRKIEGAMLTSRNEPNLQCVITFQTHSILQRFMVRFMRLRLDCNDKLSIFDGAHDYGDAKNLTCYDTYREVGTIMTRTNYLTIRYNTDKWGTDSNGFVLVISAFKDPKHSCNGFRCVEKDLCIHGGLICDGVEHCIDGSDEGPEANCPAQDPLEALGMDAVGVIGVAVGLVVIFCVIVILVTVCLCRQRQQQQQQRQFPPNTYQMQQTCGSNGAGLEKEVSGAFPGATTLQSENHYPPVGGVGYNSHYYQHVLV